MKEHPLTQPINMTRLECIEMIEAHSKDTIRIYPLGYAVGKVFDRTLLGLFKKVIGKYPQEYNHRFN